MHVRAVGFDESFEKVIERQLPLLNLNLRLGGIAIDIRILNDSGPYIRHVRTSKGAKYSLDCRCLAVLTATTFICPDSPPSRCQSLRRRSFCRLWLDYRGIGW